MGPLLEYDQANGTELAQTLEACFDNNQVMAQTASQLFVHPKTLKYRLQRIRDILGVDPCCGDRQLSLHLAIKLTRLL